MGNVVNFADLDKIIDIQEQYINQLYKNNEFSKCYESCEYLLSLLPSEKRLQRRVKKFCYLRQAVCLRKLEKYDESLEKANIALKYCVSKDDRYSVLHLKLSIYKKNGQREKALQAVNKCIKWYQYNNMHYELGMMYDIKGDLLKSEKILLLALAEYDAAYEGGKYFDKEMLQREKDNTYQRLIELYVYIGEQNLIKSYQVLNNIKSQALKEESKALINKLYKGVNE